MQSPALGELAFLASGQADQVVLTNIDDVAGETHTTILQALNRWLTYPFGKVYYGLENFTGTEAAWDAVPLILADDHPDPFTLKKDPAAALKAVNGEIAGVIAGSTITADGQPRLSAMITLTHPRARELYEQGKLSLSTALLADLTADKHIRGTIEPNHVLCFDSSVGAPARDGGAMFLNRGEADMTKTVLTNEGEVKGKLVAAIETIKAALFPETDNMPPKVPIPAVEGLVNQEIEMKEAEFDTKFAALNKAAEDEKAAHVTALANKDAEIATLKEKVAGFEQAGKDAAWTAMKNKLPKGMTHKPEDEAGLRTEFESNPSVFCNKFVDALKAAPAGTEAEGEQVPLKNKAVSRGIGTYNTQTGKWED